MTADTYGAEYDYQFDGMPAPMLWDALVAAERIYSERAAEVAVTTLRLVALLTTDMPYPERRPGIEEAYAEMRGAMASAAEQGKMVASLNRAVQRAALEHGPARQCRECGAPAGTDCDPAVPGHIEDGRHVPLEPRPCLRRNPHTAHRNGFGACPGTAPEFPSDRVEVVPDHG